MKALVHLKDPLLLGGFISNLFNGFLNPLYISAILGKVEPRWISVGSFVAGAFPAFLGILLENALVFNFLFRFLPLLMAGEIILTALLIYVSHGDVLILYLSGMFVFGIFSTSIVYLIQKVKEVRFKNNRASWDRRIASADALGYLLGSLMVVFAEVEGNDPVLVSLATLLQTILVYTFFLRSYWMVRKV
ncbi:MAG: hypothetical protein SNJ78_04280 [Spirochaetales bacterium]